MKGRSSGEAAGDTITPDVPIAECHGRDGDVEGGAHHGVGEGADTRRHKFEGERVVWDEHADLELCASEREEREGGVRGKGVREKGESEEREEEERGRRTRAKALREQRKQLGA